MHGRFHARPAAYVLASIALALVAFVLVADTRAERSGDAASRVLWTGNYESGDFAQWEGVLRETVEGGAQIVSKPVAQGRYAARFELGPTAEGYNFSRIEAHQGSVETSGGAYGAETWYRWAELVPSSSRFGPHQTFNHLVQWLPTIPCFGSALSVNGLARPARLLLIVRGGDVVRYGGSCDLRHTRVFDLGRLPRDRWLRFRLHTRWHADPSVGFVELWMNGGRKIRRTYLATSPPDVDHYVRQGLYRFRCACRTVVFGDSMKVTEVTP
jgi:hypothetical protein